jgi:SAM-dependent methyltransferase
MSRRTDTIPADYFDALYSADPDPWRFRSSDYESEKYQATLKALARERYTDALEVGCANGVFTRLLASKCDRLLALDASAVALNLAREACTGLATVRFAHAAIPRDFPAGSFDLMVFSEVLYYLVPDDVVETAGRCADNLRPTGEIVLCHWLGESDYPLTGQEAARLFVGEMTARGYAHAVLRDEVYRLDRLAAPPSSPWKAEHPAHRQKG